MRQFSSVLSQPEFSRQPEFSQAALKKKKSQPNAAASQASVQAINARIQEAATAQKIWAAIAPDNLAQYSHAASIKNQQLTVFAHSNAVAAKIKLFMPSLLIQLEKQGCEVTAIQLKVQVKSSLTPPPKVIKKLSTQAASDLNVLAQKLSGTALGDALTRLAKKAN